MRPGQWTGNGGDARKDGLSLSIIGCNMVSTLVGALKPSTTFKAD